MKKREAFFIFLLAAIGSLVALGLILNAVRYRQETRKEAVSRKIATVALAPQSGSKKPGESFQAKIILSTTEPKRIRVGGADLRFSPETFEVISSRCQTETFPLTIRNQNKDGQIFLTCSRQGGQEPVVLTPDKPLILGSIQFRVKDNAPLGNSSITFSRSNLPEAETSINLISETKNGEYIIVTPAPILNFKIKFDSVNNNIGTQKVTVKIKKDEFEKTFGQVEVTANNEGILTGQLTLDGINPGPGYTITIKGPKHLATKFCQDRQTGSCSPGETLTLQKGENNFDFSLSPLLAGDIPDENGVQNGIVDTQKLSLLKQALVSNDPNLRSRCNLDFNKDSNGQEIINGRDIVIFLKTLQTRYEDE